jgi:hypothetical protein
MTAVNGSKIILFLSNFAPFSFVTEFMPAVLASATTVPFSRFLSAVMLRFLLSAFTKK